MYIVLALTPNFMFDILYSMVYTITELYIMYYLPWAMCYVLLCIVCYIACIMYYGTMCYVLCPTYYVQCIVYYVLCTMYYVLCITIHTFKESIWYPSLPHTHPNQDKCNGISILTWTDLREMLIATFKEWMAILIPTLKQWLCIIYYAALCIKYYVLYTMCYVLWTMYIFHGLNLMHYVLCTM